MNVYRFDWQTAPLSDANAHFVFDVYYDERMDHNVLEIACTAHANSVTKEINNRNMNYSTHIVVVRTHSAAALHSLFVCIDDIQRKHHIKLEHARTRTSSRAAVDGSLFWPDETTHLWKFFVQCFYDFHNYLKGVFSASPHVCAPNDCRKNWLMKFMDYYLFIDRLQKYHQKLTQTVYHKTSLHAFHIFFCQTRCHRRRRRFFIKSN